MKLVIFGLTVSSSWGNGHATLWRGLCRSLARRGHRVIFFERDVPYYAMNRDLYEFFQGLHGVTATLLCILVIVHVLAALKHLVINRDGVFQRMLPGG